jgi:zinc and cadmium transporter
VLGLLTMFFLVRIFHFHEHAVVEEDPHAHDHDCHDPHHTHHHHTAGLERRHPYSWLGVAIGLSLHTALDGVALAATVAADAAHQTKGLLGIGTFLAIVLHKPLDAMSITALMSAQHWPPKVRQAVNAGFALMCPLGAGVFWFGMSHFTAEQQQVVGAALAFSSGIFVCIALGDLLPELQFHTHDRLKLSVALLAGVALAYAIGLVEPAHQHDMPHHHRHGEMIETLP